MRRLLLPTLLLSLAPAALGAQAAPAAAGTTPADEKAAVLAAVRGLFDAMRRGDSAAVRAAFVPNPQLSTMVVGRDGTPRLDTGNLDAFVKAVGTPHAEVWDERTHGEEVRVDGTMAVAWTPYDFYAGSTFSHCGVDAFVLAKQPTGWKIVSLADTRRKAGCGK